MDFRVIDPSKVRDISALLLAPNGRLKTVPAALLRETTQEERALFCVRHGLYGLVTTELVAFLRELIGSRTAIEIGAGHGTLAAALGIPATDNRMQEWPEIKEHYQALRQTVVPYGAEVVELDAAKAIAEYKPQVVVASWVTHLYDAGRHEAGGNMYGVREEDVIDSVETYVVIGNEQVHRGKSIWSLPHEKLTPDWLFSRASNGSPDFVCIWQRRPA